MQVKTQFPKSTEANMVVIASAADLKAVKDHVFKEVARTLKAPGFRPGKVPVNLVEKHADTSLLQVEFLEHAVNDLYPAAVQEANIRPVDQPSIDLKKFVPYTTLEFEVKVPVIGKIKLADYKKLNKSLPNVEVSAKDVNDIIETLQQRASKKLPVERAAKKGDEAVIDFTGKDEKQQPVNGADGKDYPLVLGSNAFIPGFEDNIVGMKPGENKDFTLTFPNDYGVRVLAGRKVTFSVTLSKLHELEVPALDDAFAASVGPVKTVKELREYIKKELLVERQRQANLDYESELVKTISDKSTIEIPDQLIDQEIERLYQDFVQNLMYRGQTVEEFMTNEQTTTEDYKKNELRPRAEDRVKAGVVLAEIAEAENINITPEELEARLLALKSQYQDEQMRAELDKPENRREIASRMLSEKTVAILSQFAQKKK